MRLLDALLPVVQLAADVVGLAQEFPRFGPAVGQRIGETGSARRIRECVRCQARNEVRCLKRTA
jgi:hypothetical protein